MLVVCVVVTQVNNLRTNTLPTLILYTLLHTGGI